MREIQAEVLNRNFDGFDKWIKNPVEVQLGKWIAGEYPSLISDTADLKLGVFRRLKNAVKKINGETSSLNLSELALKFLRVECDATLPTEQNIKNNLGLTKAEFNALRERLKAGEETIIEKVYLKHFEKCTAIVMKHSGCSQDMAFECSMDALIEIRSDLIKGSIRYGNLESYITSRAVIKFYKKSKKKKIVTQSLSEGMDFQDDSFERDQLVEKDLNRIVRAAITKLCEECRNIIELFYYQEMKMTEIGKQMNKSHEAIRKRASRCRAQLKRSIGEDFYKEFAQHFFKR